VKSVKIRKAIDWRRKGRHIKRSTKKARNRAQVRGGSNQGLPFSIMTRGIVKEGSADHGATVGRS